MTTTVSIKAIITGATGMVGEGVLHECLNHPRVEAVLVVGRKPCGVTHPKLKEMGLAMINAVLYGYEKPVLEVRDIVALAGRT